jgi:hypothetical protein
VKTAKLKVVERERETAQTDESCCREKVKNVLLWAPFIWRERETEAVACC